MTHVNEFPHEVAASRIGPEPYVTDFAANEKQCAALAKRYGILSVEAFAGTAKLRREADGMTIYVSGTFTADVTQACVTTLDPVPDHIEEEFEGWFLDESQATSFTRAKKRLNPADDDLIDMPPLDDEETAVVQEDEDPDPVTNGTIDVGELAAQFLSLALNPYPHSEAALESGPLGDEKDLESTSPFAVLKDLKTK